MKLKTARALDGARWMAQGLHTFRRYPIGFASLVGIVVMLMGMLLIVPGVGPVLVLACLPGLSAGWVACSRAALQGERPTPQRLLSPFTGPARRSTFWLGVAYAAAGWCLLNAINLADPGFQAQWRTAMGAGSDETRAAAMLAAQQGMLLRAVLFLPLALAFWHAPVIAHQAATGAPKALFASVVASLRNWQAFAVYGLCWVLADVALSVALGLLLELAGAGDWALALAMPASLLFCAAFYASLHASVDGCLALDDDSEVERPHA